MPSKPPIQSVDRAAGVLLAILDEGGTSEALSFAADLDMKPSTLFRYLDALTAAGLLVRLKRGEYAPSPRLLSRTEQTPLRDLLSKCCRSALEDLAKRTELTVHLGILEADMVTYVIKEGEKADSLFTQEGGQLEAYCSGIGKVLLAALPSRRRRDYLAGSPFPALTANTITDPQRIAKELTKVSKQRFATDTEEIQEGLCCLAVPVMDGHGGVLAAISASNSAPFSGNDRKQVLRELNKTASELSRLLS